MPWHSVTVKYCLHAARRKNQNMRESRSSHWQVPVWHLLLLPSLLKIKSMCFRSEVKGPCGVDLQAGYK